MVCRFKIATLLSVYICLSLTANAQNNSADSLQALLVNAGNDSIKVDILEKLGGREIDNGNKDRALKFYQEVLEIAQKNNWHYREAQSFLNNAAVYYAFDDYVSSLEEINKVKTIELTGIEKTRIDGLANYISGNNYFMGSHSEKAILHYQKSLSLYEKLKDSSFIVYINLNIANIFDDMGEFEKSAECALKALPYIVPSKKNSIVEVYQRICFEYCQQGKFKDAYPYLVKMTEIVETPGSDISPKSIVYYYHSYADYFRGIKDYATALKYNYLALAEGRKLSDQYTSAVQYREIGNDFSLLKNYDKAILYFDSSLALTLKYKFTNYTVLCYRGLSNVYSSMGKYSFAFQYQKQYSDLSDSLVHAQNHSRVALMDAEFETGKKINEINFLKTEKSLQEKIIAQKNLLNAVVITSSLVFTALLFFMYRNSRKKQQTKAENELIIAKNEERLRIAADMHDDVGAGLSRIRYISSSLKDGSEISDEAVNKIVSLSDESVEKMNEIIWALNQGNQQLEELIYYTRSQCSEMVSNAGLAFVFDLPENIPNKILGWKDCRNIYLLVKESVNNAIKHAGANNISIECIIADRLIFTIEDDGVGFDAGTVAGNGNGLLNYKKRIEKLNGTYQLITAPGKGTKIVFSIPLGSVV